MFIIVASGLSAAGLVLAARKLSASFQSLLHLSEDLEPLRPMQSGSKTPSQSAARLGRGEEPYVESMMRLSSAVVRSTKVQIETPQIATPQTDEPVSIASEVSVEQR
jgi:hypothetical protein